MADLVFSFRDPIYESRVHCYFGSKEKAIKKLGRLLKEKLPDDFIGDGSFGVAVYLGKSAFIWMPHKPKTPRDYNTLQHEVFHAVSLIFNHIGVEYNPNVNAGNEPFAYFTGYITEQIFKRL